MYPPPFYEKLFELGIGVAGQRVLDLGTGTGVLPRNMVARGATFTGIDISANQIEQAKRLSDQAHLPINYLACPVETAEFGEQAFDVVMACQCFWYFDHAVLAPKINRWLAANGRLAVMYMAWLPFEDKIAAASEKLVLHYNPQWTGCHETRHEIFIPEIYNSYFEVESSALFDVLVPFTRASWHGRIKACRGIGASLSEEEIGRFESEHKALLAESAPETFEVLHYCAVTILKKPSAGRNERETE